MVEVINFNIEKNIYKQYFQSILFNVIIEERYAFFAYDSILHVVNLNCIFIVVG